MTRLSWSEKTDLGLVRDNNEDFLAMKEWAGSFLFIIADGLGGMDRGEVASREAVEEMKKVFEAPVFLTEPQGLMEKYFRTVNLKLLDLNENISPLRMATTLTVSFFHEKDLWIGHAGDCRVYRVRHGKSQCLTQDHSSSRNVLTRVIGSDPRMRPDIYEEKTEVGDVYVQCSDGLYTTAADPEIAATAGSFSPKEACQKLVKLARERGGPDNISLQVMRVL